MRNIYKIVTGCIIFFFLHACDYPCGKASTHLSFISFTRQESDTVIVKRFTKGNNFKEQQDSLLLDSLNSNFDTYNSDTLRVIHYIENDEYITRDYDYEVFLPGANKLYKLSDITESFNTGNGGCTKEYCVNSFQSYKIDGMLVNSINYNTGIYLEK